MTQEDKKEKKVVAKLTWLDKLFLLVIMGVILLLSHAMGMPKMGGMGIMLVVGMLKDTYREAKYGGGGTDKDDS